jgi:hypothetical protein
MIEMVPQAKPSKLIPVLIGGVAMAVVSSIPMLNLVNCACCAGIMGSAVLGVWFYKKSFGPDEPFSVGQGAGIGTLSGLVGGVLMSIVELIQLGMLSPDFAQKFKQETDLALEEMAKAPNSSPELVTTMRDLFSTLSDTPALLSLIVFVVTLIVFTGFGALGGLIGGSIFKRKPVPPMFPSI